ncbi:MAG: hypothetical protein SCJ94_10245 [Bacillota bacterium]|nr:hypothetical protein [Bacillota bacterium]
MNKEFKVYLEDIGMPGELIKKVEKEYDTLLSLFSFDCKDLIVEDFVNEDGNRTYKHILLFCEKYIYEVTNFIEKPKYSKTYMANQVHVIDVQIEDFDIEKRSTRKSIIKIQLQRIYSDLRGYEINGTGENCKYIIDILKNYIDTYYCMKEVKE